MAIFSIFFFFFPCLSTICCFWIFSLFLLAFGCFSFILFLLIFYQFFFFFFCFRFVYSFFFLPANMVNERCAADYRRVLMVDRELGREP